MTNTISAMMKGAAGIRGKEIGREIALAVIAGVVSWVVARYLSNQYGKPT